MTTATYTQACIFSIPSFYSPSATLLHTIPLPPFNTQSNIAATTHEHKYYMHYIVNEIHPRQHSASSRGTKNNPDKGNGYLLLYRIDCYITRHSSSSFCISPRRVPYTCFFPAFIAIGIGITLHSVSILHTQRPTNMHWMDQYNTKTLLLSLFHSVLHLLRY